MTKRKRKVPSQLSPLDLVQHTAEMLKTAGFVFSHTGSNSTSCYYRFPGRTGTIRVGTHRVRKSKDMHWGTLNAVASITFSHKATWSDGTAQRSVEGVNSEIAHAIGRFFLGSMETKP